MASHYARATRHAYYAPRPLVNDPSAVSGSYPALPESVRLASPDDRFLWHEHVEHWWPHLGGDLIAADKDRQLIRPSDQLVFVDSISLWAPHARVGGSAVVRPCMLQFHGVGGGIDFRHGGRVNASFADGSVRSYAREDLYIGHPAWLRRGPWGWPGF